MTPLPLTDRHDLLAMSLGKLGNDLIQAVPSFVVNKPDIHRHIIDAGKEVRAGREPITQMIGRAAHETDWEGLIVPSAAASNRHNLLIFPDKLRPGSSITVLHPDRL